MVARCGLQVKVKHTKLSQFILSERLENFISIVYRAGLSRFCCIKDVMDARSKEVEGTHASNTFLPTAALTCNKNVMSLSITIS